ncbi:hypothetical protein BT63DRAFT_452250 [Microthyrium microscopicum]|uniref:Uncharacterized protein n=1 Tax=Microthyrium microscopicum TaxID=703497 RepID=A0A6A6UHJ5_9PEZI|nr:hypothetical protein BT63DRAFT_452250 [Microthyrium microscopicum]
MEPISGSVGDHPVSTDPLDSRNSKSTVADPAPGDSKLSSAKTDPRIQFGVSSHPSVREDFMSDQWEDCNAKEEEQENVEVPSSALGRKYFCAPLALPDTPLDKPLTYPNPPGNCPVYLQNLASGAFAHWDHDPDDDPLGRGSDHAEGGKYNHKCNINHSANQTINRKKICIARLAFNADLLRHYAQPDSKVCRGPTVPAPDTKDILAFLKLLFSGMNIMEFEETLELVLMDADNNNVGLKKGNDQPVQLLNIQAPAGPYPVALDANDILSKLSAMVPDDCFQLTLITDHALHWNHNSILGVSDPLARIAVVSTTQLDPRLDHFNHINRDRDEWPNGNLVKSLDYHWGCEQQWPTTTIRLSDAGSHPLAQAIHKRGQLPSLMVGPRSEDMESVWLVRTIRLVLHELGHNFGILHCEAFACLMQKGSHMYHTVAKPAMFCPLCITKLAKAMDVEVRSIFKGTLEFCDGRGAQDPVFAPLGAFIKLLLEQCPA